MSFQNRMQTTFQTFRYDHLD
jgi:hypothetical protein